MHRFLLALTLLAPGATAPAAQGQEPNTLTPAERAAGWRLLFDGKTTEGWRGYRKEEMPAGWQVTSDGALTRVDKASDIVTVEQFGSFELSFEWKIAPGGNSGVMFHVAETSAAAWHSGPEYQILDNPGHADGKKPETSAASNYSLHAPNIAEDVTRPAGAWNQSRIVVKGTHVEHWLNGSKVVEYDLGSPDWTARVKESKFRVYPNWGLAGRGHIAIQDHGNMVAFRSIKIRAL